MDRSSFPTRLTHRLLLFFNPRFPGACSECNPDVCEPPPSSKGAHCGCEYCNLDVWTANAAGPTCGDRIQYLQATGKSERASCNIVAHVQFREECGACDPEECPQRAIPRCGCSECEAVWDSVADGYSCGARITWLQTASTLGHLYTEDEACLEIGANQYSSVCGACACNGDIPASTPKPTAAATLPPVPQPTPNPTHRQTLSPTNNPTPAPTPGPTPEPLPKKDPLDFDSVMERTNGMATLMPPKHIDQSLVYTRAIPTSKVCRS